MTNDDDVEHRTKNLLRAQAVGDQDIPRAPDTVALHTQNYFCLLQYSFSHFARTCSGRLIGAAVVHLFVYGKDSQ